MESTNEKRAQNNYSMFAKQVEKEPLLYQKEAVIIDNQDAEKNVTVTEEDNPTTVTKIICMFFGFISVVLFLVLLRDIDRNMSFGIAMVGGYTVYTLLLRIFVNSRAKLSEQTTSLSITDLQNEEIFEFYQASYNKAYNNERHEVLNNVMVYPGQDPYQAGHIALLQHESEMVKSARNTAEKDTIYKYKITDHQLQLIIHSKSR